MDRIDPVDLLGLLERFDVGDVDHDGRVWLGSALIS
jgi:hypothetical protein